jgi:hypothetical protein
MNVFRTPANRKPVTKSALPTTATSTQLTALQNVCPKMYSSTIADGL